METFLDERNAFGSCHVRQSISWTDHKHLCECLWRPSLTQGERLPISPCPSPEPSVFLEGASGVCPICNGAEG